MTAPPEIPGFILKEEIGQGGIATVYSAIHTESGDVVAVKVLKPRLKQNEVLAKRLMTEARSASKIKHRNIVVVHHAHCDPKICFLVMEYLNGSLKERISDEGPAKDPGTALSLILSLVDALGHAHDQGIIHRDVKPANIMFRNDRTPVLVDFGLAKITQSLESVTKSGIAVGTPDYMSPEQIQGHAIDGRTDVYSLGAVLYEILTGSAPYRASNYVSLAMKHITKKIPRLPRRLRKIQPLLNGMMAKDVEDRHHAGEALTLIIRDTMGQL
jgi:serine/threonine-protein kinase PpkA